jgi:hypothetical protein
MNSKMEKETNIINRHNVSGHILIFNDQLSRKEKPLARKNYKSPGMLILSTCDARCPPHMRSQVASTRVSF